VIDAPVPVPDPRRPPTALDAFRRFVPDPVRCAADLVVPGLIVLASWSGEHFGTTYDDGVVTRHAAWEAPAILLVAGAAWAAVALYTARSTRRLRPHGAIVVIGVVVGALGFALAQIAPRSERTARFVIDPVVASDGAVYRLVDTWRGFGIAREVDGLPWHLSAALTGAPDGGSPEARLVRPEPNATPERGLRLACAPGGIVLAVSGAGGCPIAYDPAIDALMTQDSLAHLSPFVLLRDTDSGREDDLRAVETMLTDASASERSSFRGYVAPEEWTLLDALDSANPWVRDAARRLVRAGGAELYPEATKRL
jgi:hypothetical protein